MKRIVLTGGGTAGHVTPNLALLPLLQERGYDVHYIGSKNGIEKQLALVAGIPYNGISSGKFRRYFDLKNFTDPFRVIKGFGQAKKLLRELQPDVIFSKGGFVTVPVIFAAKRLKIPVIIHESDMTPGLANKLSVSSASKICCNFPETVEHLPTGKAVVTGCPIREELLSGSRLKALETTGFSPDKPVLLVIGGSLGSVSVNTAVRKALSQLLSQFQIIHICGKKNLAENLMDQPGYLQYEYVSSPLKDFFALADVAISRAGANAICELLALRKPNLLIPLSAAASRGDQLLNAASFEKQGFSAVLQEEDLTTESLIQTVSEVYQNRTAYQDRMSRSPLVNAVGTIVDMIDEICERSGCV